MKVPFLSELLSRSEYSLVFEGIASATATGARGEPADVYIPIMITFD